MAERANTEQRFDAPVVDIAEALHRTRLERELTLAQAAEATCITSTYLEALETNEPLEVFPAPAYAKFFLREYAQYLDLDADELVDAFAARHGIVEEGLELRSLEPVAEPRERRFGGLAVVSIVILVVLALLGVRSLRPEPSPPAASTPDVAASAPVAAEPEANEAATTDESVRPVPVPPAPEGILATLRLSSPSWIEATADGRIRLGKTLEAGVVKQLRADRDLALTLGNAGGVVLRVNGERVPTGDTGEVITLGFAWRHRELVETT